MSFLNAIAESEQPVILDTSVLINLHACGYGERILTALPNKVLITHVVAEELQHETSRRNGECGFLNDIVDSSVASLIELTDKELDLFFQLTSGSLSLDDGEAATISAAIIQNALPVIDERKGRARALALMKMAEPGWSLGILRHPVVIERLGEEAANDALYFALRDGRMRIPIESVDQVVEIIGRDRAIECMCLPGYRERFGSLKLSSG